MRLPDGHGADLISEIQQRGMETLCMVMSSLSDTTTVLNAIDAGAVGYLLKGASDAEIIAAIQSVLQGGSPIDPRVARSVLARARSNGPAPQANPDSVNPVRTENASAVATAAQSDDNAGQRLNFTPKELSVLKHVAQGLSNKQVAARLGVERSTIESHTRNIYRKLAVSSRMQAVVIGRQQGLIA